MPETLIDFVIEVMVPTFFAGLGGSMVWMMFAMNEELTQYRIESRKDDANGTHGTCGWYMAEREREQAKREQHRSGV